MFLSADVAYPNQLAARGLTLPHSEFTYAIGRLVLWAPFASTLEIERDGMAALTRGQVAHVAIANPDHAPYGRAAVAALRAAGIYDAVRPKLVLGDSVAQALQFVQSGAADVGLVAKSLALAPNMKGRGRTFDVPPATYPPLEQGGMRPTQGRTLAVMQVTAGSQSFNAVNELGVLGRWMRMITIPNQSSVPKAYEPFDEAGRMKPAPLYDRVVDVIEELMKFMLLLRGRTGYLFDRYSERKEQPAQVRAVLAASLREARGE